MHLSRKQTHRMSSSFTWSPILVYVQTVAPSSILAGKCVRVLSAVLCVLHFRRSLCLRWSRRTGSTSSEVFTLLHTLSHAHFPKLPRLFTPEAPPSCASRGTFTFSALHTGLVSFPVMEVLFSSFGFMFMMTEGKSSGKVNPNLHLDILKYI